MTDQGHVLFGDHPVAACRGVELAESTLSDVFLPVELAVRQPKRLTMTLNAVRVGRATVGYMRFDQAFRMTTAETEDYYIDVAVSGSSRMRAGLGSDPQRVSRDRGMIFNPGRPALLDCERGYAQLSTRIPTADLRLAVESLLDRPVAGALELEEGLDLTTEAGRAILDALVLIERSSHHADGPLSHPLSSQNLERILIDALLFAQPHNLAEALKTPHPTPGSATVARAVELIRDRADHPWTVGELAREVSTSSRSLHEGFRRTLSTTPMAYLRQVRLERAHEDLASAAPATTTVSQVAYRWGFANVGRFSAEYRRRFGELPSRTLRH